MINKELLEELRRWIMNRKNEKEILDISTLPEGLLKEKYEMNDLEWVLQKIDLIEDFYTR